MDTTSEIFTTLMELKGSILILQEEVQQLKSGVDPVLLKEYNDKIDSNAPCKVCGTHFVTYCEECNARKLICASRTFRTCNHCMKKYHDYKIMKFKRKSQELGTITSVLSTIK